MLGPSLRGMARPRGEQFFLETDPECTEFYWNGVPKYALLTTHEHAPKRYERHSVKIDSTSFRPFANVFAVRAVKRAETG